MTSCDSEIAALRHRVTLEAPVRVAAEGGTATVTWSAVTELWAAIEPRPAREMVLADNLKGRVTHTIRIRFRPGVDATQRFRLGTRLFEIRSVYDEHELHRSIVCGCEETTA